ncbi:hypothetical protein BJ138DRAFT_977437, partial [Hygrophoropsis aurantiaca]
LSERDKAILRAFAYKVKNHGTENAFNELKYVFPAANLPSLKQTKSRVNFLAGLEPQQYDCCLNSCIAFTGPHETLDTCPHCREPRYNSSGRARKKFPYIPVIPRLVAFVGNPEMAQKMQYRSSGHAHDPGTVTDIFDGSWYQELCTKKVTINSNELKHNHFSDPRDIALGLSTDGFAPFRRRKTT